MLEGITVCVDYSDFLEETIKFNKKHFDRYIVVTSSSDRKTQELCIKEGVHFSRTDSFWYHEAKFNKGLALSTILADDMKLNGWICIHDADVCLPFNFREKLKLNGMDIEKMYGCSRKFIPTYKDWQAGLKNEKYFDRYKSYPGYGCGFMQLFNTNSKIFKEKRDKTIYGSYPTAEQCDIHFLYHWCPPPNPMPERLDMDCYHLTLAHGTAHAGRHNSIIEEFKKDFKDQKEIIK
jgi:hypothetical protein